MISDSRTGVVALRPPRRLGFRVDGFAMPD
jgi:hypothetical protein